MLQRDKRKPLLNRAIMGAYPPGSTFKTAQALTFLQEGIIHEDYPTFPCAHGFNYGSLHVAVTGTVLLAFGSGNSHFVQLLFLLGAVPYVQRQEVRFSAKCHYRMERPYGVAGIRLSLGTDLPGEQRGLIPNAKFMIKHIGALGTDLR